MNKALGVVFLVVGVLLAVLFVSTAFMHGYASGMRNLGRDPTHFLFSGGAAVCFVVGIVALVRKPR